MSEHANAPLPLTETGNPRTVRIDAVSTRALLALINDEDRRVPEAVAAALDDLARAVDGIYARLARGGRMIYIGAGTSGRLGVVDASEMPPTYNTPRTLVLGLIAGGESAMFRTAEGAEDHVDNGRADLDAVQISEHDAVVGIAASGRTPYVIGALRHARALGAFTVSIACTAPAAIHAEAEVNIALLTGPEAVTGSTRMKAGTATKLALNMISTACMIKLGKTFGNLMVDLQPTNQKLRERAVRIVATATGVSNDDARTLIDRCGDVKTAIVCALADCTADDARARLARAAGRVRDAIT
jgi:N-acetylmuramic acid 6-phosphate etherase